MFHKMCFENEYREYNVFCHSHVVEIVANVLIVSCKQSPASVFSNRVVYLNKPYQSRDGSVRQHLIHISDQALLQNQLKTGQFSCSQTQTTHFILEKDRQKLVYTVKVISLSRT